MLQAVGFDIDGTLYPDISMYTSSIPAFFRDPFLMWAYGKTRKLIRDPSFELELKQLGFRRVQAKEVLRILGRKSTPKNLDRMELRIENNIYRIWEHSFKGIKAYPNVRKAFSEIREKGIKIGLLSDFPVAVKPETLQIHDIIDFAISSEASSFLKPAPAPFFMLAEGLGVSPEAMVYIGNSYTKDIVGAGMAGMKTVMFHAGWAEASKRKKLVESYPEADRIFSDYRELPEIIETFL